VFHTLDVMDRGPPLSNAAGEHAQSGGKAGLAGTGILRIGPRMQEKQNKCAQRPMLKRLYRSRFAHANSVQLTDSGYRCSWRSEASTKERERFGEELYGLSPRRFARRSGRRGLLGLIAAAW
jgi:hypothetical protein